MERRNFDKLIEKFVTGAEVIHAANRPAYQQTRGERNEQAYRDYIARIEQEEASSQGLANAPE